MKKIRYLIYFLCFIFNSQQLFAQAAQAQNSAIITKNEHVTFMNVHKNKLDQGWVSSTANNEVVVRYREFTENMILTSFYRLRADQLGRAIEREDFPKGAKVCLSENFNRLQKDDDAEIEQVFDNETAVLVRYNFITRALTFLLPQEDVVPLSFLKNCAAE